MVFIRTFVNFLKDPEYRDLLGTTFFILFFGTMVYHHLEGWDYLDSLYFSIITLTTIGYGDFSPQTEEGKMFTIFYIFLGIGIVLAFINTLYNHFEKEQQNKKK
ncbi:MAG: potassium channel family protein [Saprospiraceae bacterium]|jgi:voltage-gated potassium channel|nr:potassium channel family protein [Saprospiraceae bacterium]MDG2417949.1 potassium channel family protein [Saprospiraceae bacterium]